MSIFAYTVTIPSNKEEYSTTLDEIAKGHGVIPKIKSTANGLKYSFEFNSEEKQNKLKEDISDKMPDLFK